MSLIKKLTSKNKSDYEMAASHIINNADVSAFEELVSKDDFLFDFIKSNVSNRLEACVNKNNFKNLLKFLPFYSSSYVEFIAKSLAKFSDIDLETELLNSFETATNEQKAYCAKYFSIIKSSSAINLLRISAYSEYEPLALNSAEALASLGDVDSYDNALSDLSSDDDFKKLSAVKFLVAYGNKNAIPHILEVMKKSSMSEHIASELPYLDSIFNILDYNSNDGLYLINLLIDGIGEVSSISQIFDYQLYDVLDCLSNNLTSKEAVVLLNAISKFNTLTENDEYLYDEDKNTKNEVYEIKRMLTSLNKEKLISLSIEELNEDSDFVFSSLDLVYNVDRVVELTNSNNPTLVLKALSALKINNDLSLIDKNIIINKISDENIKAIILAL